MMTRRVLLRAAAFGLPAARSAAGPLSPSGAELRRVLLEMRDADQKLRAAVLKEPGSAGLRERLRELDRRNTLRMKEIVRRHGWPTAALAGRDGASAAWLLVQHADHDPAFQRHCLELIRPLFRKGEVDAQSYAFLTDRVLLAEGKKQRYGTQFRRDGRGRLEPAPIEHAASVDARRKELGLQPLAEYRKELERLYAGEP